MVAIRCVCLLVVVGCHGDDDWYVLCIVCCVLLYGLCYFMVLMFVVCWFMIVVWCLSCGVCSVSLLVSCFLFLCFMGGVCSMWLFGVLCCRVLVYVVGVCSVGVDCCLLFRVVVWCCGSMFVVCLFCVRIGLAFVVRSWLMFGGCGCLLVVGCVLFGVVERCALLLLDVVR